MVNRIVSFSAWAAYSWVASGAILSLAVYRNHRCSILFDNLSILNICDVASGSFDILNPISWPSQTGEPSCFTYLSRLEGVAQLRGLSSGSELLKQMTEEFQKKCEVSGRTYLPLVIGVGCAVYFTCRAFCECGKKREA